MIKKYTPILLADDDWEDQDILKEALWMVDKDLAIDSVFNGEEAIAYLNDCDALRLPCLIVLDYKMPLLNAEDVLGALEGDARYRNVPKVVWSTSRQPEHIEKCMNKGAVRYFVKPASSTEAGLIAAEMIKICKLRPAV